MVGLAKTFGAKNCSLNDASMKIGIQPEHVLSKL